MKFLKTKKSIVLFIISMSLLLIALGLAMPFFISGSDSHKLYVISILCVYMAVILGILSIFPGDEEVKKRNRVKEMAMVGIMGAISSILYIFVKFNLPFFPSFLDIQISEIPALIVGFAYGPVAGIATLAIRFVVKLPLTSTASVGEFADLLIGIALVVPTSIIYKKHRTFKGAIVGFSIGVLLATITAMLLNWLVLIQFYVELYFNGDWAPIIGMCSMIPNINQDNFFALYLFAGVLPFNLFRYLIVGIITFLIYKRAKNLLDKVTN